MKRILLTLSFLLLTLPAGAAEDFQLWTEAGVRIRLAKGWRLKFDQHFRFDESYVRQDGDKEKFHSLQSIIPEVAISYRVLRFLRLEVGCRFIEEIRENIDDPDDPNDDPRYGEPWGRIYADARFRYRLRPVTLRYRLRYQETYSEPWTNDVKPLWRHTVRNKIGAEIKLAGGFVPFLSGELFMRIKDPDGAWHKWRVTAGLDWEIDPHVVTLFYRLEDMLDDDGDRYRKPNRHILGIGYHYAF